MKQRCFGNKPGQNLYAEYHDHEWGIPCYDDLHLFEMLVLEGAQAGLNWETILKKREGYRRAYQGFDVMKVAQMTDRELEALCQNPDIIRNRLKVFAARKNAIAFLEIQKEYGSFSEYLWQYVDHQPIKNQWKDLKELPAETELSRRISKDLKKRGMSFVGPTIMYAYLQAVGVVDDHLVGCWKY